MVRAFVSIIAGLLLLSPTIVAAGPLANTLRAKGYPEQSVNTVEAAENVLVAGRTLGKSVQGASGTIASMATSADEAICATWMTVLRSDLVAMQLERATLSAADKIRMDQAIQALQRIETTIQRTCDESARQLAAKFRTVDTSQYAFAENPNVISQSRVDEFCRDRCSESWTAYERANTNYNSKLRDARMKAATLRSAQQAYNISISQLARLKTNRDKKIDEFERVVDSQKANRQRAYRMRRETPPRLVAADAQDALLDRQLGTAKTNLDLAVNRYVDQIEKLEREKAAYETAKRAVEAIKPEVDAAKEAFEAAMAAYEECRRLCPANEAADVAMAGVWQLEGTTGEARIRQSGRMITMITSKVDPQVPSFEVGSPGLEAVLTARNIAGRMALRLASGEAYAACPRTYWVRFSGRLSDDGQSFSGRRGAITIDLETCASSPDGQADFKYNRLRD